MTTAILREELHDYINAIPERKLRALRPLLSELAEESLYTAEPASPEECKMIDERVREF